MLELINFIMKIIIFVEGFSFLLKRSNLLFHEVTVLQNQF